MTVQDISLRSLSGSKGAKTKNTADNLFATDVVEVLLGVSEGPIVGLAEGAKSFVIGQTPLKDPNNEANFDNFELIDYKGSEVGEDIHSRLGGFGASTTVNTRLETDVSVIRTGQHTQIDYVDFRFTINQLVETTKKGTFENTGKWRIEYKPVSSTEWKLVRTNVKNPLPPQISGDSFDIFYGDKGDKQSISAAPGDRPTYWASSEPISTANAGIWFNTANNYQPKVFDGKVWALPKNAKFTSSYWTWSEASSWGADKSTKAFVGATLPKGAKFEQGDYWLNTNKGSAFFYNGSTWVIAGSTLRPGTFGENGTGGTVEIDGDHIELTAKTSQPFPKEFRVPVARIDEPYMFRVTKVSPINTTEKIFEISWESFQEVTSKSYNFPGTATTQLVARASDQFSSIPDFGGVYRGRIVRVPSNYNPVTRVYTGVWDGTWKLAYTNNPAFIGNDLIVNDRYGMNAYYPITLNKWDVYEAGQWCDVRTASGSPRFTYNGLISDPRGGRDALNYIFGIFAGRFFDDGNGSGVIKIDKDGGAAVIFSPENVVEGVFTYSFTEISTRHNDITVVFTNPDLNWQEDRRPVRDEDHIAQYGRIPHNFIAVGCTNAEEAIRRARYHLITGIKESMMVNFKTNRMGRYLSPYDVILISDPDMEFGLSGRVKKVSGARKIQLRDPLFFEPGFAYKISFQLISGATNDFVIESRDLVAGTNGALTELTVTADLPALPEDCVFTIEQVNGDSAPIAFRVMSINEIDGDPDNVDIQAMVMHRAKWLYVDGLVNTIGELDRQALDTNVRPKPVPTVRVQAAEFALGGQSRYNLMLDWDASDSKFVSRYKILSSRNNDPLVVIGETTTRQFSWTDVPPGEYIFHVIAVDAFGNESLPTIVEHRFIGDLRVVESVQTLRMVNEPYNTIFESQSPRFSWEPSKSPEHDNYLVQVRNLDGSIAREVTTSSNEFQYEFRDNTADHGEPARSFTIAVASQDQYGFLSDFETLTVTNTAPGAPTLFTVEATGVSSVLANTNQAPERDVTALVIHMSQQAGFTPSAANRVYEGVSTNVLIPVPGEGTFYFRAAFRDSFSASNLNYAPEQSVKIASILGDLTPPLKPTGLKASSSLLDDGQAEVVFTWEANTEEDLATYDIQISENGGGYVSFITSQPRMSVKVRAGSVLKAVVRASDKNNNVSGLTEEVTHVAAKDSTAPAVPTGFKATGNFAAVWLEWNHNAERDFDFYEVYESTSAVAPDHDTPATLRYYSTTNPRSNLPAGTTFNYWLRAVDTSGNRSDWTSKVEVTTLTLDGSVPAPAIPDAPTLASTVVVENGLTLARITATWAEVPGAVTYEVGIQADGQAEVFQVSGGHNSFTFDGLPGVTYKVRVRAIGSVYNKSWYSSISTITPAGDTVAPKVPAGLVTKTAFQTIWLDWLANTENDFSHYEVFETTSSAAPTMDTPATFTSVSEMASRPGLTAGALFTYYIRAVDTSGNKSAWSAPVSATTLTLEGTLPAPAMPTGLVAAGNVVTHPDGSTTAKVTVAWVAAPGATGYEIGIRRDGAVETLFTTGGTTFEFDVIPGITYHIRVRSLNPPASKSDFTDPIRVTPAGDLVAPAAPGDLKARTGFQTIWLNWSRNAESDFKHYEIFESASPDTPAADAKATYLNGGETLTLPGLPDGLTRHYWVRSVDFSGNKSAWSLPATATTPSLSGTQPAPAKPSNLNASSVLVALPGGGNTAKVTATWAASENAASYEIGIKRAGASETIIAVSGVSYEFDAIPGVTYEIRVCAINALSVRSEYTSVFSIKPAGDTTPPAPVTASIAAGFESLLLKFSRNTESDFKEYEVYYSANIAPPAADTPATFKTTSDTMNLTGLAAGAVLHFWVRSADFSGNKSVWSSRYTGTASGLGTEDFTGLINTTSFAAGLSALGVGEALPQPPFTDKTPKKFYVPSTGHVYNQKPDGTGWISETDASLIVGKLKAGQIEAGAIGAEQMAAKSIRAVSLAIGDFTNMADLGWTIGDRTGWDMNDGFSSWYKETAPNHPMMGEWTLRSTGRHPAMTNRYTVSPGDGYYFDVWVYNTDPGRVSILINTIDENGGDIWQTAAFSDVKNQWTRMTGIVRVPPGHTKCLMSLFSDHAAGQGQFTYWARPVMRKATGNVMIENGAVTADKVTAGELITGSAQIRAAIINNAHITELDAGKIQAGSVISNFVRVAGSTGQDLGNIQAWATDPASRINSAFTQVDPGRIVVSGATTLADWRHGNDTTTIDGGKVFAGSITTRQLAVTNGANLIEDSLFRANFDYWDIAPNFPANAGFTSYLVEAGTSWASPTGRSMALRQTSGSVGGGYFTDVRLRRNEPGLPAWGTNSVPVKVGEWIEAHVGFSFHRCIGELRLEWRDVSGNVIAYSDGGQFNGGDMGNSSNAEQWPRWRVKGQAPNNACSVGIHIRKLDTTAGQSDSYVFVYKPMLCRVSQQTTEITPWSDGAVTRITGNQINTGVIKADHLRTDTAVITGSAQIANAVINTAHISELSATKLQAYSAIASSITVDGTTFGTIRYGSEVGLIDPVNRINSGSTKVDPGKIVISGAATLADWRGTTDTTQINGGKIQTDSIDVRSLRVGNFTNLVDNGWASGSIGSWFPDIVNNFYLEGAGSGQGGGWNLQTEGTNVVSRFTSIEAGEYVGGSVWFYNTTPHRAVYYIQWFNSAKEYIRSDFIDFHDGKNYWVKMGGNIRQAPAGTAFVRAHLHIEGYTPGSYIYWNKPTLYKAYGGELIVEGAIKGRHLTVNEAVITGTAQIADAVVTNAKISDLDAAKIHAGSVISNFVRVAGSTGQDLGNIQAWATDPASRINGIFTQIDPGKIVISGSTSLANWRGQTDTMRIPL